MKQLVFLVISLTAAGLLWAQDKPSVKPEAMKKEEPMKEAAKEPARQAGTGPRIPNPRRWHEDARHCLERGNNTDIIKCAEEFL